MDTKIVTKEMREQLRRPLPNSAVTRHPTKTFLSSIKSIYVTERLNEVFGVGGWTTKVEMLDIDKSNGMVLVMLTFEVPRYGIFYQCPAGNDNGGADKRGFDLGDACKGAVSDAIGKIGSWLEIGIDVYKGEKSAPATNGSAARQAKDEDNKEWLNEGSANWNKAVAYLLNNKNGNASVQAIRTSYKIGKKEAAKLEAVIVARDAILNNTNPGKLDISSSDRLLISNWKNQLNGQPA